MSIQFLCHFYLSHNSASSPGTIESLMLLVLGGALLLLFYHQRCFYYHYCSSHHHHYHHHHLHHFSLCHSIRIRRHSRGTGEGGRQRQMNTGPEEQRNGDQVIKEHKGSAERRLFSLIRRLPTLLICRP